MSAHLKNTLSLVSGLLGLALIVLVTITSCGGGALASAMLPAYDQTAPAGNPPEAGLPQYADVAPAPLPGVDAEAIDAPADAVEPALPDPPAADLPVGAPPADPPLPEELPSAPAEPETYEPLDAIPVDFEGYAEPYSGYLSAAQTVDGSAIPGGAALRFWNDEASGHLAFAYFMDWQDADEAGRRLAELRPRNAVEYALADGGWQAEDASQAGYPGFRAVAFRHGSVIVLAGAGISDAKAIAAPLAALQDLAASIHDFMLAHELRMPEGLAASALGASSLRSLLPLPTIKASSGAKQTAYIPLDLLKGGKKAGSITFKLEITVTDEQCNGGPVFIVDVFIAEISLGDDDGDGFGKGAGDIMVGGDISVSFNAGGHVTSGKVGSFATGEVADVDENSTAKEGDEDTELPKFIGSVKGCGFPEKIDFDVLVRDSDEGTDVQDLIGVGGSAAAEYLVGNETAKRIGEAIDHAGEKAKDESGTDGMKKLRERAGDDIGESHDKQVGIEPK